VVCLCLYVCWSRSQTLQKRLNRSRFRLDGRHGWAKGTMYQMGSRSHHRKGQFFELSGPLEILGISAAVYAAKGVIQPLITACSRTDHSIVNDGTTGDAAVRQNSRTTCYFKQQRLYVTKDFDIAGGNNIRHSK